MTAAANAAGVDVPWLGQPFSEKEPYGLLTWESVNTINPFLVWHQPHVIWMAEAQRRAAAAAGGAPAAAAVLAFHAPLVDATASFLASFPQAGPDGLLRLGAPIMGGEEEGDFRAVDHPAFERTYFAWAIDVANEWRVAQGLPPRADWAAAAGSFAPPAVDPASPPAAPLYAPNANASCCLLPPGSPLCPPGRFGGKAQCSPLESHPLFAGLIGMLDGRARGDRYGVDVATCNRTLAAVLSTWHWGAQPSNLANVWGWDFPFVALSAARLGWSPDAVVAALLRDVPKNNYTAVGHNTQRPGLLAYLPGNGGTLIAVAAMAAGFGSGANDTAGAGFPSGWGAAAEGFAMPYP